MGETLAGAIACVRPRAARQDPRDAVLDPASPEPAERSRRLSSSRFLLFARGESRAAGQLRAGWKVRLEAWGTCVLVAVRS